MGKIFRGRGIVTKEEVLRNHTEEMYREQQKSIADYNRNIFKNKIVTSDMQQKYVSMKGSTSALTLLDIMNDPKCEEKFGKYEFPKFTKTESGEIFFQPIMRVISPLGSKYVKFFSPLKDFSFPNDHSYDFARLHEDGYLMKVEISRQFDKISGFEICYITPVMNVDVSTVFAPNTTGANIYDAQVTAMPQKMYRVSPFNPAQYLQMQEYLYHPEIFIDEYLQDAQ